MATALLEYKTRINGEDKTFTLENGALRYIDNITKEFTDEADLKNASEYRKLIHRHVSDQNLYGTVTLSYVKDNQKKINLPIIYNDEEIIRTRTSSLEDVKSEVEKARKLLLNSKSRIFLRLFLENKNLSDTTFHTVKMTFDEYKYTKAQQLNVFMQDNEYLIPIHEVLKYRLNNRKMGAMRLLIEDTLEEWKNKMLDLPDEELYFYSRELRVMINDYNYRKIPRRAICRLDIDINHLRNITDGFNVNRGLSLEEYKIRGLAKRKILEDRRTGT